MRGAEGTAGAACLAAADAGLGLPGRPQSGTGQTALLTGWNAPAAFGRHFGPWVPTALRPPLAERNLLRRAADAGLRVAFANAYPPGYLDPAPGRRVRPAAPPLAAHSAGVLDRGPAELRTGRAVASSITNTAWRTRLGDEVPDLSEGDAGANLAAIAGEARLTLFAHYDTDLAGHRGDLDLGVAAVERVDRFLAGLLDALPAGTLLVVSSDHGNLEDVTAGHTLNPVPVLAVGPGAERATRDIRAVTDLAPALLGLLGVPATPLDDEPKR